MTAVVVDGPLPGARHWIGVTWMLALRGFRLRYLRSRLGIGWALVQPLVQTLVLSFVFSRIFKVGDVEHYPLYVLSGIMTWQAFSTGVNAATTAVLDNAPLLRKIAMPAVVFPLAQIGNVQLAYVLQLGVLILLALVFGTAGVGLLLLPLVMALLVLSALSVGLLTCALQVRYNDVKFLVEAGLLVLFYLSPVLYTPAHLSPTLARFLELNPMYGVLSLARTALLGRPMPWGSLVSTAVVVSVLLVVGGLVFRHRSREFADLA